MGRDVIGVTGLNDKGEGLDGVQFRLHRKHKHTTQYLIITISATHLRHVHHFTINISFVRRYISDTEQ